MVAQELPFEGRTLLLADNIAEYRETVAERLASLGANVLQAGSEDEARLHIARHEDIDLAILDNRLTDGGPSDKAGLYLAREINRKIPVILISIYDLHDTALDAIRPTIGGGHPVFDVFDKREGVDALITKIRLALETPDGRAKELLPPHDLDTAAVLTRIAHGVCQQAERANLVTTVMVVIGTLVLFTGVILLYLGRADMALVTGVAGLLTDLFGALYLVSVREANRRLDKLADGYFTLYQQQLYRTTRREPARRRKHSPSATTGGRSGA